MDENSTPRVAVITGSSRGIGEATVQDLAAAGLDVALLARNKVKIDQMVSSLAPAGALIAG